MEETKQIMELPLALLRASQHQKRGALDPLSLEDLAASIRQHGVLSPIKVRPLDENGVQVYEVIFGHRRWEAAKKAGLETVPAVVVEGLTEEEAAAQTLVENLQRDDLNPMAVYESLLDLKQTTGATWEGVAAMVGKTRRQIYRYLTLGEMPEMIREYVRRGALGLKHLALLRKLPEKRQLLLAEEAATHGISARALESRLVGKSHREKRSRVKVNSKRTRPEPFAGLDEARRTTLMENAEVLGLDRAGLRRASLLMRATDMPAPAAAAVAAQLADSPVGRALARIESGLETLALANTTSGNEQAARAAAVAYLEAVLKDARRASRQKGVSRER